MAEIETIIAKDGGMKVKVKTEEDEDSACTVLEGVLRELKADGVRTWKV